MGTKEKKSSSKDKDKKKKDSKKDSKDKKKEEEPTESAAPPKPVLPTGPECESCQGSSGAGGSTVYCIECDLLLCDTCNKNAHLIRPTQGHQRVPFEEVKHHRRRCPSHPTQKAEFYCEPCQTIVCSQCKSFGLHSSEAHDVLSLSEAYQRRSSTLRAEVSGPLLSKKNELLAQAQAIESLVNNVRDHRAAIERETRCDADAIVRRLKAAEATKTAPLKSQLAEMKEDVLAINNVTRTIAECGTTNDIIKILEEFPKLMSTAEDLRNKVYPTEFDVDPADFEHETRDRHRILETCSTAVGLVEAKDQIIKEIVAERDASKYRCSILEETLRGFRREAEEMKDLLARYEARIEELMEARGETPQSG